MAGRSWGGGGMGYRVGLCGFYGLTLASVELSFLNHLFTVVQPRYKRIYISGDSI